MPAREHSDTIGRPSLYPLIEIVIAIAIGGFAAA